MRIGKLRERVTIQKPTTTRDAFNAEVITWATTATTWAQVVDRGGSESIGADVLAMLVDYEVTIRTGVEVTHKDRLLWRGKTLEVQVVTPRPAEGLVVLRCSEVQL